MTVFDDRLIRLLIKARGNFFLELRNILFEDCLPFCNGAIHNEVDVYEISIKTR